MTKKLSEAYPHLLAEWNDHKDLNGFSPGSNYQADWKCERGHEWKASVGYRVKGYGSCLACVSIGYMYPGLAEEWDAEKNTDSPFDVRAGSGKKVWWKSKECQHSWLMEARARVRNGYGCPYCSGQRVLAGFNDLRTTHPELAAQWDEKKNKKASTEVTYGSKAKAWWTDETCGHSWKMSPLHRTKLKDSTCTVCRSVAIQYPALLKEWNDPKDPYAVAAGSSTKVSWKCSVDPQHHIWKTAVYSRSTQGQGCPYCSGRQSVLGQTDVLTTHPHLLAEWDDREDLSDFSFGSNYKAQWRCSKNQEHTWRETINDRATKRSHCPYCANHISRKEQELTDFVNSLGFTARRDRKLLNRKELDICIPEKKIAIEFNGIYWHSEEMGKDKWYHYNKWADCQKHDIQLFTIWEDDWDENKRLIKEMLSHKLGVSTQGRIAARKTHVMTVGKEVAQDFYHRNHLQGHKDGSEHIALVEDTTQEVVALSTWSYSPQKQEVRLDRFATSKIVQGGFSKLLEHMKKSLASHDHGNYHQIVTFADHTVSDGKLYANNGFIADKELTPDYMYVYRNKRRHKFGFRIKRFRNDPNLKYVEGYTERELAKLNGIQRIWDCGKTRYVLPIASD